MAFFLLLSLALSSAWAQEAQERGVKILADDAMISMGVKSDVRLSRQGTGLLIEAPKATLPTNLYVGKRSMEDMIIDTVRARIKPHVLLCTPGWDGPWCDTSCKNAAANQYYDSPMKSGGNCAVASCSNVVNGQYYKTAAPAGSKKCVVTKCTQTLKNGQFFSSNGGTTPTGCKISSCTAIGAGRYFTSNGGGSDSCKNAACTNVVNGQYYKTAAPAGSNKCVVAMCTQTLKNVQFFSSNGGTTPTGCKISSCTNIKEGQYYKAPAPAGSKICVVAACPVGATGANIPTECKCKPGKVGRLIRTATGMTGACACGHRSPWKQAGTLSTFVSSSKKYPHTLYEWGVKYNHGGGDVHTVVANSWNKGTRLTVTPNYPQGDTATSMEMGTAVFVHNTNDSPGKWTHYYYRENSAGKVTGRGGNGIANTISFWVSKRPAPWMQVGTLSSLDSVVAKYPLKAYKLGVKYNTAAGAVHDVTVTTWNKGLRVTCYPWYPQGDSGNSMNFGTAMFVKGTNGQKYTWQHHYIKHSSTGKITVGGGNGDAKSVTLWVQERVYPWTAAGPLPTLSTIASKYPHSQYEYGTAYNMGSGSVSTVVMSSWNKGTRVTQYPMYPQGDTATATGMSFGTAIFVTGTEEQKHSWQHYYYREDSSGRTVGAGGNGNAAGVQFYVKKRVTPWKQVGTLGQWTTLVGKYPMNKYDYAVQYNTAYGAIHSVVANSWNKGTRVTCYPHYAQLDTGSKLQFGTVMFLTGTNGQTNTWQQYYYREDTNSKTVSAGSNGNAAGVRVYVSEIPASVQC